MNVERSTSNVQLRTKNGEERAVAFRSTFEVRRWTFDVRPSNRDRAR